MSTRPAVHEGLSIQDASAWILRAGVVASVVIMIAGASLTFAHRPVSVWDLEHTRFDGRLPTLWRGVMQARGQAVIELGIYVLVFTPIIRVLVSMVLFLFEEHDRLYALVTFCVLLLTLAGLFFLR